MMDNIISPVRKGVEGATFRSEWEGLTVDNEAAPFSLPVSKDFSVQVFGTFGDATVVFECSNERVFDKEKVFYLKDKYGTEIGLTSGGEMVEALLYWIRPKVVGGDDTTDLTVVMLDRKA